jgi:hypothetical protein
MLILKMNSSNIIGRLFAIPISIALLYLIIHYGLNEHSNERIILCLLYFIIAGVLFYLFTVLLSFLGVTGVKVEIASGEIIFISVIKTETVSVYDIKNYFETIHRNRWQGLMLILNSGREIQLAGQNLEAVSDFKNYLIEKAIPCLGTKSMKYPFN